MQRNANTRPRATARRGGRLPQWMSREAQKEDADTIQTILQHPNNARAIQIDSNRVSSIQRIPPEVFGEIFALGRGFKQVLSSSHVCRLWRSITTSIPNMWSYMDIQLGDLEPRRQRLLVQLWLARSGSRPITFHLTQSTSEKKRSRYPAMEFIMPQASRWQDLKVDLSDELVRRFMDCREQMPLLQRLHITGIRGVRGIENVDVFSNIPQLRYLSIDVQCPFEDLHFPWAQLTECHLLGTECNSADDCLDLLRESPNLLTCTLTAGEGSTNTHADIQHLRLKKLYMIDFSDSETFFSHLTLPALEDYEYFADSDNDSSGLHFPSLGDFLSQSPLLRRLRIQEDWGGAEYDFCNELQECLEQCPSSLEELELLSVSSMGMDETLLGRLTHKSDAQTCCLLPKLRTILLETNEPFDLPSFANMLESRWRSHGVDCGAPDHTKVEKLRKAELWGAPRGGPENHAALEILGKLEDDGLDIVVK